MIEWSETDLLVRDSIRAFIDAELRPHVDALESGEMTPYPIIRKLFAAFGVDVMAREALDGVLAKAAEKLDAPLEAEKATSAAGARRRAPVHRWPARPAWG